MARRAQLFLVVISMLTVSLALVACGGKSTDKPPRGGDAAVDASTDGAILDDATVPLPDAAPQDGAMTVADAAQDAAPTTDCHGSRTCDSLVGLDCVLAGCEPAVGGDCGGTPAACSTYNGIQKAAACGFAGCSFNFGNQKCTGMPKDCDEVNAFLCGTETGVQGCTVSGACSGEANPCSDTTFEIACNAQPGCSWM